MKPYFQSELKDFTLYHADSFKLLKEIPEESIDMIFADPPYFLSNGSFTCQNGEMVSVKKGDWDIGSSLKENFEFHYEWLKLAKRLLKPNGTLWVSSTYHSTYQIGFAIQKLGYHILNDIVWYKKNAPPNLSGRFFTASHENLLWVRKHKAGKHTFNYIEMKNYDSDGDFLKVPGKQMRSVWAVNSVKPYEKRFGKHPTQKPEMLLKRIILSSTKEGDTILDPFSGSGTTGIVAIELNRKFIGIDNESSYLDISINRVTNNNGNYY
ncbi:MAG: site-specific DNA-methyltransferase [Candidatus Dojkabacteria bacterium]|nr:MAG: site-specific DNA-methyltransferase [Candidatus Dojkabacteria bacterium]